MPDNKVQFSGAQPGEGTGIPAPVEQAPQSGTPAPQTEATTNQPVLDLKTVQELIRKAEETAFNRARAYTDKKETTIQKRVTEQLETLKSLGFQPTPQQEQALKDKVIQEVTSAPEPAPMSEVTPPAQAAPTAEPGNDGGAPDALTSVAWGLMQEAGVTIEDSDPEAALFAAAPKSMTEAIRITQQAIEAKRARVASGAVPLGGGMGEISQDSIVAEIERLASENPHRNFKRIQELKARLR